MATLNEAASRSVLQLDLFQPVPDTFWDDIAPHLVPGAVQLARIERAIASAEAVFRRTGHNRNHQAYRLLVSLRKQRDALRAA